MTTTTRAKSGVGARLSNLQAGVQKNFTNKTNLLASGTSYTQASLLAAVAAALGPYSALAAFLASAKTARQTLKNGAEATALGLLGAVVPALRAMYGTSNVILLDFGITPTKEKATLTAQEQVAKAAKAVATRKLRGTLGSKQKAQLKATGAVTITTALAAGAATPVDTGTAATPLAPVATAAPAAAPTPTPLIAPHS